MFLEAWAGPVASVVQALAHVLIQGLVLEVSPKVDPAAPGNADLLSMRTQIQKKTKICLPKWRGQDLIYFTQNDVDLVHSADLLLKRAGYLHIGGGSDQAT